MVERLEGCAFHTVRTLGCVMCDDIATGTIEFVSSTLDPNGYEVREFRPPAPVIDIGRRRPLEVDYSGCEAVGVGGYHSLGYGDAGGYCNWCGKGSPVKESKGG